MITLQHVQQPCWKVVPNAEKLIDILETMLRDLRNVNDPEQAWNLNETRWKNAAPILTKFGVQKNTRTFLLSMVG